VVRRLHSRDRALITAQWFTGFRISEVLSLRVATVYRNGAVLARIAVPPRHLKGGYGGTHSVPVVPELRRALEHHARWLDRHFEVTPDLPLFPSRKRGPNGRLRAISRFTAHEILNATFRVASVLDDGRLGTHSLRKTFANVYHNSGHDIALLKSALHHSQINTTIKYLEVRDDDVTSAIVRCDFTRRARNDPTQPLPSPAWPRGRLNRRSA